MLPRGHLGKISGDIFGCHNEGHLVLLVSSGESPEMLLSIVQGTGEPLTTKDDSSIIQSVSGTKAENPYPRVTTFHNGNKALCHYREMLRKGTEMK